MGRSEKIAHRARTNNRTQKNEFQSISWYQSMTVRYSNPSLSVHLVECAFVECALVLIYHPSLSAH